MSTSNLSTQPTRYYPPLSRHEEQQAGWILMQIQQGHTLTIDGQYRNGLILCKPFHAEFAGPGATIGGAFDLDCREILAIGNLSVQVPTCHDDSQKAYRIRRAWMRLIHEFTRINSPHKRAKKILTQFEMYFGKDVTAQIPDRALALLVGVLPHTIQLERFR